MESFRASLVGAIRINLTTQLKGKLGAKPEEAITAIVLPSTLVTIEDFAFYNHRRVNVLTIPKQVQSIGKNAFMLLGSQLPKLLALEFESGSQLTVIKGGAFYQMYAKNLVLPEQLETIGKEAFRGMQLEETASFIIPAKVKNVTDQAFLVTNFTNTNLTIMSPNVSLGKNLFVIGTTENRFTTIKLHENVYGNYTKAQLANRFGAVTAYQDLKGNAHAAKTP